MGHELQSLHKGIDVSPVTEAVARGASRAEVEQLLRHRFDQGLARLDPLVIDPALEQHAAVILKTLPCSQSWASDVRTPGQGGVVLRPCWRDGGVGLETTR
jgi:hypothetical protein